MRSGPWSISFGNRTWTGSRERLGITASGGEAARILHHRALMVGWIAPSFDRALRYAGAAVANFRESGGRNPIPGTLALLLSGLATWQEAAGHHREARGSVEEALALVGPLVKGKPSVELFLLYCQLGSVCGKIPDREAEEWAREEAGRLAKGLSTPGAERHLNGTLSWAQWAVQRFIGF